MLNWKHARVCAKHIQRYAATAAGPWLIGGELSATTTGIHCTRACMLTTANLSHLLPPSLRPSLPFSLLLFPSFSISLHLSFSLSISPSLLPPPSSFSLLYLSPLSSLSSIFTPSPPLHTTFPSPFFPPLSLNTHQVNLLVAVMGDRSFFTLQSIIFVNVNLTYLDHHGIFSIKMKTRA